MLNEIQDKIKSALKKHNVLINKKIFFESAVLIPLIKIEDDYGILLQVRADNIRQGGEISFPGGKIDSKDKSSKQTAVRETCEELGISKNKIKVFGYIGSYLNPMGTLVHGYLGELKINDIKELKINEDEVKEIFTVPLNFFKKNRPAKYHLQLAVEPYVVNSGKKEIIFPAEEIGLGEKYSTKRTGITYPVYFYKFEDKIIWGITAYFIHYFVETIK